MSAAIGQVETSPLPATATFLDALVDAVLRSAAYNSQAECPPAAILWTDEARHWVPLLPQLRERLPLVALGPYSPETRTGPAYWLRCVVDGTLPIEWSPGVSGPPVIYLPGVSRPRMRAVEDCPRELQPLAELQYRGVFWSHKNGKDWTVAGFLGSTDGRLGVEVGADAATRQALARALPRLAVEPVARLWAESPLRIEYFNTILNPDEARSILQWLDDPEGYPKRRSAEEWASLIDICTRKYGFHPERDGEVTAAGYLGGRNGAWQNVWSRFAEAPGAYPNIPDLLRRAQPEDRSPLFYMHPDSWPQENEEAEVRLRERLAGLEGTLQNEAREAIRELEAEQGPRRSWVWARLGRAPLAQALEHLAALASRSECMLPVGPAAEIATAYAEWGWTVDAAAIDALASVAQPPDVAAIKTAVTALYRPWLEGAAVTLQAAVSAGPPSQTYPVSAPPTPENGTCVLFTDALRYDAGMRLAAALKALGLECDTGWRLTALPSLTPTAKPAVSPVAARFTGVGASGLDPILGATGTRVTIQVLRRALVDEGYQVLHGEETGDPAGRGWTEAGSIDAYGHGHGWRVATHLEGQIRELASRVQALLSAGWRQVVVVTDHGWVMLPGGLPKAELPEHLTEVRKGRCARLKQGASTQEQTVPWQWDPNARIAVARGIHAYEAGKEYEHGGLSPQECVVPVLKVTSPAPAGPAVSIEGITWRGLRCRVQATGPAGYLVDIRTKPADPGSSVVKEPKGLAADGTASLVVPDDELEGTAAVIVVLDDSSRVQAQRTTMIGEGQ